MSNRKQRHRQFEHPRDGVTTTLSTDLLRCAASLLRLALRDRTPQVHTTPTNHYSPHALGAVLVLTAGFDAWLSEAVQTLARFDAIKRRLAQHAIGEKYYRLAKEFAAAELPWNEDLELLLKTRHEIAHYLPRALGNDSVPPWLSKLEERGLFLATGRDSDFTLGQKLASYRLAYWAWQTVEAAAVGLVEALGPRASGLKWTAANFSLYRDVPDPSELAPYDAKHGLTDSSAKDRDG